MGVKKIRIAVSGACGKVGIEMVKAVVKNPDLELIAALDIKNIGTDIGELAGLGGIDIPITEKLDNAIWQNLDVIIDFTNAKASYELIKNAISKNVSVVSGTTGFTTEEKEEIRLLAEEKKLGIVLAPNFALGAVLMLKFCKELANWFSEAEIIEMHNPFKLDAPSGTAIRTAELIQTCWQERNIPRKMEELPANPARGYFQKGVPVHSVRLPGVVAHQEVIFGGLGQTLSIKHDSYSRESFVPGVLLAVRKVKQLSNAIFGLEYLLFD